MTIIVCYTKRALAESAAPEDHWEVVEDMAKASELYNKLTDREDIYTASICNVIKSTDYGLHV
jgi:uncharacterized protein YerC